MKIITTTREILGVRRYTRACQASEDSVAFGSLNIHAWPPYQKLLPESFYSAGTIDTLHLLFGNLLAVTDVICLTIIAALVGLVQLRFTRRFLLVASD